MSNCKYTINFGELKIEIDSSVNSENEYTLQDLSQSVLTSNLDFNKVEEVIKNLKESSKATQDISDVSLNGKVLGITSLKDVVESLDVDEGSYELSSSITMVVNKLMQLEGFNIDKLNVIPGDYSSSEYSLSTRYNPDTDCILLNTNNLTENVYADLLKALIDQYIYHNPDLVKAINERIKQNYSAGEICDILVDTTIKERDKRIFFMIADALDIPYDIIFNLNKYRTVVSTILTQGEYSTLSDLQELYSISKGTNNYYTAQIVQNVSINESTEDKPTIGEFYKKLNFGDIVLLDMTGQRMKSDGTFSTKEDLENYYKDKDLTKFADKSEYTGKVFMFISTTSTQVKLYDPIKKQVRFFNLKDPVLFWEGDKTILYKDKKRIWSDKNLSEKPQVRVRQLNTEAVNNPTAPTSELVFKTKKEFENAFKEAKKTLIPSGFQDGEKLDPSVSKLLEVGDYFLMTTPQGLTTYYIKAKTDNYFEVEYISSNTVKSVVIYFKSLNPKVVYFKSDKVNNINITRDIIDKMQPVTDKEAIGIADVGDIIGWVDKVDGKEVQRYNYVIGVNKESGKFKILIKKNNKEGSPEAVAGAVRGKINGIYKDNKIDTQKLLLEKLTPKLESISKLNTMLLFPGDNSSIQMNSSDPTYHYMEVPDIISENCYTIIKNLQIGDIVKLKNGKYLYIIDNLNFQLVGIDTDGQYFKIQPEMLKGIFYKNLIGNLHTYTNRINLYYVDENPPANLVDSTHEKVPLFLLMKKDLWDKRKNDADHIDKMEDFSGARWSTNESIEGYVNVTQDYTTTKSAGVKKGKVSVYGIRNIYTKLLMTRVVNHEYINGKNISEDRLTDILIPSTYISFKPDTKYNNTTDLKMRWFRIVEKVGDSGYMLNYSAYNSLGTLESTTFYVTTDFLKQNFHSVKVTKTPTQSKNNFTRKSLTSCILEVSKKKPKQLVDIAIDSIFKRLGIETITLSSEQIKERYGDNYDSIKGFVTIDQNRNPIVVLNSDNGDLAQTKLHELMHLILGTFKVNNYENYRLLINDVISALAKSDIVEYQKIIDDINTRYANFNYEIRQEEMFVEIISKGILDDITTYLESRDKPINVKALLRNALKNFFGKDSKFFGKINKNNTLEDILTMLKSLDSTLSDIKKSIYDPEKVNKAFGYEELKKQLIEKGKLKEECK